MRLGRLAVLCLALGMAFTSRARSQAPPDPHYKAGALLASDDFAHGLGDWRIEMEKPGSVSGKNGALDIDVPAGCTVWYNREFTSPLMISYDATVISAGGPNDRVSDLNSFWMATDPASPADFFAHPRTGAFAGYNTLHLYYVGVGGNSNTTTRFRRYVGDATERPMLRENDISVKEHPEKGITANKTYRITLIADESLIQYWRDYEKLFQMNDPEPYTRGWFGIRTTKNHMQVRNVKFYRLIVP